MRFLRTLFTLVVYVSPILAVGSTDEYRDADLGQSSYLPNHNMDPNIVNSAAFGQLWKIAFNTNEQFYAKPLTYTPLAGGNQLLFLASSMNYVRTLDAKNGTVINSRQLHTPFLQSDIGCYDIPNYIGIIGTPTIDPTSDIVYLFSKTYVPNIRIAGNTGMENGVYYFHAININTLADVYPPVLLDGAPADNAPTKYFVGGPALQRPSLTQIGTVVYGAFGSSCDLFNFTGLVIGMDINQGKIVSQFAMESGPLSPGTTNMRLNGGGGEAGIWMSGMGISTDGNRLFVVTGNGAAHQNVGPPVSGSSLLRTLGEAAVNLAVETATGKISLGDWFQPYDYQNMDGGDQDYGSGGIVLLDPATFSGGGVDKIAITCGKNGKIYVLNANNLGGFRLGAGNTDAVVQTIATNQAIFGAAGSYPGEGGYIYFCPDGYPMYAYGLGFTAGGVPQFSNVAKSNEISTGRVGVGIPTVTSMNGKPGTAILWLCDPGAGLRAWYAVPQNGVLVNIPLPQIGGSVKFQRPAFGDGRVYTTDSNGVLYCLGSPVSLPLNCTSVDFGQVPLGSKATQSVTCTANIAITSVNGLTVTSPFSAANSSLPTGALAMGATFSFPVVWDLTNVQDSLPGIKSAPLTILTTNAVTGFANSFPISLTGTEISQAAYLSLSPRTTDFGAAVILDPANVPSTSLAISIANKGLSAMKILGYGYTKDPLAASPVYVNSTFAINVWDLGVGFTAATLPAVGSTIAPGVSVSLQTTFLPPNGVGIYSSYWTVFSDGGTAYTILEGSASTAPIANFSIGNGEGGWLPAANLVMDFGTVAPGSTSSRQIQICNSGGSSLSVDKSKPPSGVFHPSDPTALQETQRILPGACAYGTVLFVASTEEYNIPNLALSSSWTLNTNDLNFGVHVVQIMGTVVSNKVGPTNSSGATVYNYLGCFTEATTGPRLFPNQLGSTATMTNAVCQTSCLGAASYGFAGTEFGRECWCGNTPPPLANQDLTDTLCNFACTGDGNDRCGSSGYVSVFYDPTKYTAGTDPSLYGPQVPQVVANYNYQGCFSEPSTGRALAALQPKVPTTGFTLELCVAACQGYSYAGMEYANQCYCGNTLGAGSVNQTGTTPSSTGCSMTCTGNALEYCGGGSRLQLYMLNTSIPINSSSSRQSVTSTSSLSTVISSTVSVSTTTGTTSTSSGTISTTSTSGSVSLTSTSTTPSATPSPTLATVTNLPGYIYLGCYSESTTGRALSGFLNAVSPATNNNIETCAAACAKYTYFGTEYGSECFCGNVINAGSVNQTSTVPSVNGCNLVCANNAYEYCGGRNRLNMYQVAPVVSSSSSGSSIVSSTSVSSSSSSVPVAITSTSSTGSSSSTVISSTSSSLSSSSTGVSSTTSSAPSTSTSVSSTSSSVQSSSTSVPSTGSSSSSSQVSSSSIGITSTSSLISSSSSQSSLAPTSTTSLASSTSSLASSTTFLTSSTSSLASSTTSSSSSVSSSSSTLTTPPSTVSSSSTLTSSTLTTSTLTSSTLSTSTSLSSSSSSSSSLSQTSTSTASTPLWTAPSTQRQIGSQLYMGCYTEATAARALAGSSFTSTTMTVESCQSFCAANNYALSGIEYASQCYCSNSLSAGSVTATGCTMGCSGNAAEKCGGSSRLSVFNNTAYVYPSAPPRVGNYALQGCYKEATVGRLFPGPMYTNSTGMTLESCTTFCAAQGANGVYAAVEYSQECYCGATLPASAVNATLSSCNMLCKGNNKEYCGAGGFLDVYMAGG